MFKKKQIFFSSLDAILLKVLRYRVQFKRDNAH